MNFRPVFALRSATEPMHSLWSQARLSQTQNGSGVPQ